MTGEPKAGFNEVFSVLDSAAYRAAIEDGCRADPVPSWVLPYSFVTGSELAQISRELRLRPHDAFVDLGCGLGGPGLWVAAQTGADLTGVDFSGEAIARASRRAIERGLRKSRFIVADMTNTDLPGASFEGVMSVDAIAFADPRGVVAEIARLLKPGGMVALTTFEPEKPKSSTAVSDYRPYFEECGFQLLFHQETANWRENMRTFYAALEKRADALRAELGAAAEGLLEEAARAPLNRRVMIVAAKR